MVAVSFLRFEGNPKSRAIAIFFAAGEANLCGQRSEKPSNFSNGMVASPLAAAVVAAILRYELCAAKICAGSSKGLPYQPGIGTLMGH